MRVVSGNFFFLTPYKINGYRRDEKKIKLDRKKKKKRYNKGNGFKSHRGPVSCKIKSRRALLLGALSARKLYFSLFFTLYEIDDYGKDKKKKGTQSKTKKNVKIKNKGNGFKSHRKTRKRRNKISSSLTARGTLRPGSCFFFFFWKKPLSFIIIISNRVAWPGHGELLFSSPRLQYYN